MTALPVKGHVGLCDVQQKLSFDGNADAALRTSAVSRMGIILRDFVFIRSKFPLFAKIPDCHI